MTDKTDFLDAGLPAYWPSLYFDAASVSKNHGKDVITSGSDKFPVSTKYAPLMDQECVIVDFINFYKSFSGPDQYAAYEKHHFWPGGGSRDSKDGTTVLIPPSEVGYSSDFFGGPQYLWLSATLELRINGDAVTIPDVNIMLASFLEKGKDADWFSVGLQQNWITYDWLWSTKAGASKKFYGRNSSGAPVSVLFEVGVRNKTDVGPIKATIISPIGTEDDENWLDEFNYKLACKRVDTSWAFDPNVLLKSDSAPITDPGRSYINLSSMHINDASVVQISDLGSDAKLNKSYANQFILRNATSTAMAMKTSDYSKAVTHTFSIALTEGFTSAFTWSTATATKTTWKIELPEIGDSAKSEETVTNTFTKAFTFNVSSTQTWTTTETETITAGGQTVTVPANTALKVNYDFWSGAVTGKLRFLIDLAKAPKIQSISCANADERGGFYPLFSQIAIKIDWVKAKEILSLSHLATEYQDDEKRVKSGSFVYQTMIMTADVGVIGSLNIEEIKPKAMEGMLSENYSDLTSNVRTSLGAPTLKSAGTDFPPAPVLVKAAGKPGDMQHHYSGSFTVPKDRNNEIGSYVVFLNGKQVLEVSNEPNASGQIDFSGINTPGTYDLTVRGVCSGGMTAPSNSIAITISKGTY
jgi:hypothetical protein